MIKTVPGKGAPKPGRGGERVAQTETTACGKEWRCGWYMMYMAMKEEACKVKGAEEGARVSD